MYEYKYKFHFLIRSYNHLEENHLWAIKEEFLSSTVLIRNSDVPPLIEKYGAVQVRL